MGVAKANAGGATDPLLTQQWYLQTGGAGLNVVPVWQRYDGTGVTVGIWDDGVEYTHPDLAAAFDPALSPRFEGVVHDPAPEDATSRHGTAVAGIIAAARNGNGTVGVAYGAHYSGVDIFEDSGVVPNIARTYRALAGFDVTNHSYTFAPYIANRLDPAWSTFFSGWTTSVRSGRDGLGTVNVVSAGNGRLEERNTNDSNLSAMPEAITVAAVGRDGYVTETSTPGASLLVSAPGEAIWTTDRVGVAGYSDGWSETGNRDTSVTNAFSGTSAAAPMVAGVVALMLDANPALGFRDVQTILAATARHVGSGIGEDPGGAELSRWMTNGAATWNGGGMHFSNDYGFGLVDARAAVRLAESWTAQSTSANWVKAGAALWTGKVLVPDDNGAGVGVVLAGPKTAVDVETVSLRLDFTNAKISDYEVRLVSPAGTEVVLATAETGGDAVTDGWTFQANAFRGESSAGNWQVLVSDLRTGTEGTLVRAQLTLMGAAASRDDLFLFTDEFSDLIAAGRPKTVVDRDGGVDTVNASALSSATQVDLGLRTARVDGVKITLSGIENVVGGDGTDSLTGSTAANRLEGGRGNDVLKGSAGLDSLFGGSGADKLYDGSGADRLAGGVGRDVFYLEKDGSTDRILDFQDGSDQIALGAKNFRALSFVEMTNGSVRVDYAGDRLVVSSVGHDLDVSDFTASDFLFT